MSSDCTAPCSDAELLAKIGIHAKTRGWRGRAKRRANSTWTYAYFAPGDAMTSKNKYSRKRGVIEYNEREKEGACAPTLLRFFDKKSKS